MASDKESEQRNDPVDPNPAGLPQTEVQSSEAVAESAELSIPEGVTQNEAAPTIAGYVLADRLGEGAYGMVWRAWQLRTRKEVALKVFMQRTGLDWIFLQREVERLTRLDRHPHIVTLLDTNLDEEPPFYVMDLIEGGSLDKFVSPEAAAPVDIVLQWADQICDALSYVHAKGLIHCDLKPANILVDEREHVRVVDFGQSRVFTESSASLGTLFFMAPEQARQGEPGAPVQPDVRWDVYALGATLYAIITGRVPYGEPANVQSLEQAENLTDRLKRYRDMVANSAMPSWDSANGPAVGPELAAIIEKCLAKNMEDRYETVAAFQEDLHALRKNRPVTPLAGSTAYRVKKFAKRNPLQIGITLVLLALGVTAALAYVERARDAASETARKFVSDPGVAVERAAASGGLERSFLEKLTRTNLTSAAFTERVMGARSGLCVAPDAFWQSVDGGPLWEHGEWLEIARTAWDDRSGVLDVLAQKLADGTPRQKYVALCLIGQLGKGEPNAAKFADKCATLATSATEPGVISAAWWAAGTLGKQVAPRVSDHYRADSLTGLYFATIPAAESFRMGSDADEVDRLQDEDRPAKGVAIGSIMMSTSEVPSSSFAMFTKATGADSKISLESARAYCTWLNGHAAGQTPKRVYRLPTEEEWEHACRAGSTGRFSFGDSNTYARFFAACDGEVDVGPVPYAVAQRMPSWYGLFDMHGGYWELTSSRYPPELVHATQKGEEQFTMRGGAYYSPARRCRSAQRNYTTVNAADGRYFGIRLVMEIE